VIGRALRVPRRALARAIPADLRHSRRRGRAFPAAAPTVAALGAREPVAILPGDTRALGGGGHATPAIKSRPTSRCDPASIHSLPSPLRLTDGTTRCGHAYPTMAPWQSPDRHQAFQRHRLRPADERLRPADALGDLAQLLAREGREKEALALASEQKSPAVKARILLGVIMGKANAKLPKPEAPK